LKYLVTLVFALSALSVTACGAAPDRPVDKDQIRSNADDAHRDADREGARRPKD